MNMQMPFAEIFMRNNTH